MRPAARPWRQTLHFVPRFAKSNASPDRGILAFPLLPLSQPDTGSAAVLVDELDAGGLQCTAYR
jgi:hypothetical protein